MNLKSLLPVGRDRSVANSPFVSLQREIDRLFDDFTRGFPTFSGNGATALMPSMDVSETDKEIEITAELPGLEEKDVQINMSDNLLTIRGEKKAEKEQKDKNYRLVERSYGSFERTLELPEGVSPDAIKANIAKGVLKVTIPKPAPALPKKFLLKWAALFRLFKWCAAQAAHLLLCILNHITARFYRPSSPVPTLPHVGSYACLR
jgi:HSP20 family protein